MKHFIRVFLLLSLTICHVVAQLQNETDNRVTGEQGALKRTRRSLIEPKNTVLVLKWRNEYDPKLRTHYQQVVPIRMDIDSSWNIRTVYQKPRETNVIDSYRHDIGVGSHLAMAGSDRLYAYTREGDLQLNRMHNEAFETLPHKTSVVRYNFGYLGWWIDKLYACGCRSAQTCSKEAVTTCEFRDAHADGDTAEWEVREFPEAMCIGAYAADAALDGKLYLTSDTYFVNERNCKTRFSSTWYREYYERLLLEYDYALNTWAMRSAQNYAPYPIVGAALVPIAEKKLLMCGGYMFAPWHYGVTDECRSFDTRWGPWRRMRPMEKKLMMHSMLAFHDDLVVAVGGKGGSPAHFNQLIMVYNTTENHWFGRGSFRGNGNERMYRGGAVVVPYKRIGCYDYPCEDL